MLRGVVCNTLDYASDSIHPNPTLVLLFQLLQMDPLDKVTSILPTRI
jgi:hypothetical protein